MNSSNPALNDSVFSGTTFDRAELTDRSSLMTMQGTMAKTAIMLLAVTVSATFTWQKVMTGIEGPGGAAAAMPWMLGGAIGGLVVGLIIGFKPKMAPSLAVPYALLQGLMLGAISAFYALRFDAPGALGSGIVLQAVVLTFGTAFAMRGLYAFRIIRLTERMKSIIFAATGGIMLFYLISFVLGFFGVSMPLIHSAGPLGIAFSVFVVGLAAFNLLMDFEFIENGANGGAPKYMEWYGAFALVVTLIWLYIEFLRLLAKMRSNE